MNATQDIIYNVTGQSLVFDAPEGRPSGAPTVTVYESHESDDGSTESATTGSASVESDPDTTVDQDSGISQSDATQLYVAATTGMAVGRSYLLTAGDGNREWIEIQSISSGDHVILTRPLLNDYSSGDTVESTRIAISLDDTWVQDEANISDDVDPNPGYRVRWEYTVGGVTHVHHSYFDVVRYPSEHSVTPVDMENFRSNWANVLPIHHAPDVGQRLIDEAHKQVAWDLHKALVPDEMIRHHEGVNHLTKYRAWLELQKIRFYSGSDVFAQVELAQADYNAELEQLVRVTGKLQQSVDTTGAAVRRQPVGIWQR